MVALGMEVKIGPAIVLMGPSASGKTRLKDELRVQMSDRLGIPVSDTDRQQRPTEIDGKCYHFISEEEFQYRKGTGQYAYVFQHPKTGKWYGMRWQCLDKVWQEGKIALLDIGIDIYEDFIQSIPDALSCFIFASRAVREERIVIRGDTPAQEILLRLAAGEEEIRQAQILKKQYPIQFIDNDDSGIERAYLALLINIANYTR